MAEERAPLAQRMPSSVRDIRIVPGGVMVWEACSEMQKCLNRCPFSLSVKPGMFLLALVSCRDLKMPVKRSWWHCLKKEPLASVFFPRKSTLQQAIREA